jgi:hypothetical protein
MVNEFFFLKKRIPSLYRVLGRGVEFGEPSHVALEREFQE